MKHSIKLAGAIGVVVLVLAGCGGSDSTTGSSTSADSGAQSTDTTGSGQGVGGPNTQEDSPDAKGDEDSGKSQGEKTAQAKTETGDDSTGGGQGSSSAPKPKTSFKAPPVKVSGGGSSQFIVKGGDNSIQEYGDEGDDSELQEVADVVHSFYAARSEERWDDACAYLSKSNIESLEKLGSGSPQLKDAGCGSILHAFTRPLPAPVQREITTVDAGSFRHEGEQGFLIYYGAGHTVYAMPMHNEDGTWKVTALSASAIG